MATGWIALLALAAVSSSPAGRVKEHIARLASDSMEGRAPGTPGGERAAGYIAAAFEAAGLRPLPGVGFFQPVPLVGHRLEADSDEIVLDGRSISRNEFVMNAESEESHIDLSGRIVAAGYGISLPDLGWDDYRGLDVQGAIVALLPGAPPEVGLPGGEQSFAGRDSYKIELAQQRGAVAVVFLESGDVATEVAESRREAESEQIRPGFGEARPAVVARVDGALLGQGREARLRLTQRVRRFEAPNVIGFLPGSDPRGEAVLITAHYDAYGIGPADPNGDGIYNGALDNASGVAALLELAREYASREPLPRTLVFVATTAEERGTLGMRYYVSHPAFPIEETIVQLNLDGLNVFGPTNDFLVFPSEGIELEPSFRTIGERAGMTLAVEPWQRAMHFSFDTGPALLRGLVGVTLWQGSHFRDLSRDEAAERRGRFGRIHRPSDEWPDWADDAAIEQHLGLYRAAIESFAREAPRPSLSEESPFRP